MSAPDNELSRRVMLRRLGAGAAVAWTAPALVSVGGAVANAASPACGPTCPGFPGEVCGDSGPFGQCFCSADTEGNCFCWENFPCSGDSCTSSAECPAGWRCEPQGACGGACAPPCGQGGNVSVPEGLRNYG